MAKKVTEAQMRAFRTKKREVRKKLDELKSSGRITGQEYIKRVSRLARIKVGDNIPASLTSFKSYEMMDYRPTKRAATGTYDRSAVETSKPRDKKPVPVPTPKPKKTTDSSDKPMPSTLPVSPPKGRKTKKKEKLYVTIDPKTGKEVDKKVTAAQHLANLDEAKRRGLRIGSQRTKADRVKAAKEVESKIKALVGKRMNKGGYANCGASMKPTQKSTQKMR